MKNPICNEWVLTLTEGPQGHGYWQRYFEGPDIGENTSDPSIPNRVLVIEKNELEKAKETIEYLEQRLSDTLALLHSRRASIE